MSNLAPFLDRNRAFADTGVRDGLTPIPAHQVLVVTCMDGRVDPAYVLGVELGDALVIRNAGGRVTDDVLTEIAFVGEVTSMMFGADAEPFEVAIIHHTGCGSGFLADPEFRRSIAERSGAVEDDLERQAVTDPIASVRDDLDRLRAWSGLPDRVVLSGHVYDIETGLVTPVDDDGSVSAVARQSGWSEGQ